MRLSKSTEKYIRSLSQKKFRQQYNKFLGEGDKLVREILSNDKVKIEILLALEEWYVKNEALVKKSGAEVVLVSERELRKISQLKTPNQVLVVADQLEVDIDVHKVQSDWSLYLDRVQDPGNFGTILRIANWFGIAHIFCSPNSIELYNPKVIQASMGAFLRVNVMEKDFTDFQQLFPKVPIYATAMDGHSIFPMQQRKPGLLVLGNEGQGITSDILSQADEQLSIPRYGDHQMESLNVAVAAGIILGTLRGAS